MSPPAHLMLRGLPQRVASLELAWHAALRQRDIHAAECLHAPQCCQPARANAMASPPAHVLAPGQPHHDPQPGWLDQWQRAASGRSRLCVGVLKRKGACAKAAAGSRLTRYIIDDCDWFTLCVCVCDWALFLLFLPDLPLHSCAAAVILHSSLSCSNSSQLTRLRLQYTNKSY